MKTSSSKLFAAFAAGFCLTIGAVQTTNAQNFILTYDFSTDAPVLFFNGAEVDPQFFTRITATAWGGDLSTDAGEKPGEGIGANTLFPNSAVSSGFGLQSKTFDDGAVGPLSFTSSFTVTNPGDKVTISSINYNTRSSFGLPEGPTQSTPAGSGPDVDASLSLNTTALTPSFTAVPGTWTLGGVVNAGATNIGAMTDLTGTNDFEFLFSAAAAGNARFSIDNFQIYGTIVPEPSAILGSLFGIGMIGIVGYRRRFGKKSA